MGSAVSGNAIQEMTKESGSPRSVYVHAPFCARRCFYCDFPVTVAPANLGRWLEAIERELALVREEGFFEPDEELTSLFVGGGTPSLLGADAMAGVAEVIGLRDPVGSGLEWTAEANPDSFSAEVARGWSKAGVNRISLGVQSFQPGALRWLRRLHGPEGARNAIQRARAAGIENINLDLMFGLPREVARNWALDLDTALSLRVPHLSLYGLTVEKGTPLCRSVEEGSVSAPREEDYREEYLRASERLTAEGYQHYEVSNFAWPGHESLHNEAYWRSAPYLGLGNGAHSFRGRWRRWNLVEWEEYQKALEEGNVPWGSGEELDDEALRLEGVWLGLRTSDGLATDGLGDEPMNVARSWKAAGWARITGRRIRLTPTGWLLLDELALTMDSALRSCRPAMG